MPEEPLTQSVWQSPSEIPCHHIASAGERVWMMMLRLLALVTLTYVLGLVKGFRGAPRLGRSILRRGGSHQVKETALVLKVKPDLFSGAYET